MDTPPEFERDAEKAATNYIRHGVSFLFATAVFRDPMRADFDASRPEDQEEPRKAVGRIGRKLFAVVYTVRGDVIRLISARRTNRAEDHLYGNR